MWFTTPYKRGTVPDGLDTRGCKWMISPRIGSFIAQVTLFYPPWGVILGPDARSLATGVRGNLRSMGF